MTRTPSARDTLFRAILTVGWAGRFPVARGTAGTAAGVFLFLAVRDGVTSHPWQGPLAGCLAASVLVVLLGRWAERFYGTKDPQEIVLDEVAGIFLTFAGFSGLGWPEILAGFLLFRGLDIVKPFPARQAQKLPAGWGIVVDDLAAAVYANLLLRAWTIWGPR